MTSLYGRLFHASSVHRERLEDFLTEALGDLLNRVSKSQLREFCSEFLLNGCGSELKAQWLKLFDRRSTVTWETQQRISVDGTEKRPDMILYQNLDEKRGRNFENDRVPLLAVECKVGAPFSARQLHHYGHWLAEAGGPATALVVITHLTEIPSDFQSSSEYCVKIRAKRKWSELCKWLRDERNAGSWCSAANVLVLANELVEFMEEKKLMTEEPTWQDLAAARMFLISGAHARLRNFMTSVRAAVQANFKNLRGFPEKPPEIGGDADRECGQIQDWCNFHNGIWVYWGIYLGADFWSPNIEPPIKRSDAGFLYIEFKKRVSRPADKEFAEWHFPSMAEVDDFSVAKMVDLDQIGADSVTAGFSQWLIVSLEEAKRIIELTD
jgi:hypothetical protein